MPERKCFSCEFLEDHGWCEKHGKLENENNHVCEDYEPCDTWCPIQNDPWSFSY
jgi:hypothetical protein